MIENHEQYKIIRNRAKIFQKSSQKYRQLLNPSTIEKILADRLESQAFDLWEQVTQYERSNAFPLLGNAFVRAILWAVATQLTIQYVLTAYSLISIYLGK